ncbi:MAG TPA: TlpA disulfide reductase family protein, partial [Pseudogracilibacillus sp.]|nr:TlpA disulfide reductase family protein [Pseudogracilibacillus sp.]
IFDFVAKDKAPGMGQGEGLKKGDIAPDFELETLSGETVTLADYRGQKVMLNFWATWCPPCRAEMPDMQKVQDERDDVVILAVNQVQTESNPDNIAPFLHEIGVDFTVLLDENTFVGTMYQAKSLPLSYLINTDGTIEYIRNGPMNHDLMMKTFDDMH